jgi:hypothetical protein
MVQEQVGFLIENNGAMKNRIVKCHLGHVAEEKDMALKADHVSMREIVKVLYIVVIVVSVMDHLQCLAMKIHVDVITKIETKGIYYDS